MNAAMEDNDSEPKQVPRGRFQPGQSGNPNGRPKRASLDVPPTKDAVLAFLWRTTRRLGRLAARGEGDAGNTSHAALVKACELLLRELPAPVPPMAGWTTAPAPEPAPPNPD